MIRATVALIVTVGGFIVWNLGPVEPPETTPAYVTAPAPTPTPTTSTTTTTTEPAPSVTTATVIRVTPTAPTLPPVDTTGARCGEWWDMALAVGWPADRLQVLDDIIWDESRCLADANRGPWIDIGLLQINRATWTPLLDRLGYTIDDLLDPGVNLYAGLLIAGEAEAIGWRWCQPWDTSGRRTCS